MQAAELPTKYNEDLKNLDSRGAMIESTFFLCINDWHDEVATFLSEKGASLVIHKAPYVLLKNLNILNLNTELSI
jgi:hypothetical protein